MGLFQWIKGANKNTNNADYNCSSIDQLERNSGKYSEKNI